MLYQLEVKSNLVQVFFHPANEWRVTVDVDAMERGKGGQQKRAKIERTRAAYEALKEMGVTIGAHDSFGRVDVVAEHPEYGLHLIEVEGESSRQREQAIYSAIGQLVLAMDIPGGRSVHYGLAVPEGRTWRKQLAKIPVGVRERLDLSLYAVGRGGGTKWASGEAVQSLGR